MKVRWEDIVGSQAWSDLWSSDELEAKRAALLNTLQSTALTDPYHLGLVRGELKALNGLKELGEQLAAAAVRKESAEGAAVAEQRPARGLRARLNTLIR